MKRKAPVLALMLLIQLLAATIIGTSVTYALENGKAPQGLKAMGIDLAGLTRSEAWQKIEDELPSFLEFGGQKFPLRLDQTKQAWRKWLDAAYEQKSGFWLKDAFVFIARMGNGLGEAPVRLSKAEVLPQLETIKAAIEQPPVAARIAYQGGQLVREQGQAGQTMDLDKTWEALLKGEDAEAIKVNSLAPNPSDADVAKIRDTLGDYTTFFDPRDQSRTTNVRLAAQALDGKLIAPGRVFSFNNVVGERTELEGYLPAFVFVNRDVVKEDGGGVCQDSSTLFQTVKQAHLEITERHSHSLPVAYVPRGQDATVAWGLLDFSFRNDTQGYLLISARMGRNWVRIRIFGTADSTHPVLTEPGGFPEHPMDWNSEPK